MTQATPRRPLAPGSPFALLPAVAVVVVAALLLSMAPPARPKPLPPPGWPDVDRYSNGLVTAEVSRSSPVLAVSPTGANGSFALLAGLGGIQELGGNGASLAYADFTSPNWTIHNGSSASGLDVTFESNLSVVRSLGGGGPASSIVSVRFANAPPNGDGSRPPSAATISVEIDGWPWRPSGPDAMVLLFPLLPSDPASAQIAEGPANTLYCVDNGTHAPREFLHWADHATAVDASGQQASVAVAASVTGTANNSTVSVLFSGGTTPLTQIQYTVDLGIVTPTPRAPISGVDAALEIGFAIVAAGVVAYAVYDAFAGAPALRDFRD